MFMAQLPFDTIFHGLQSIQHGRAGPIQDQSGRFSSFWWEAAPDQAGMTASFG